MKGKQLITLFIEQRDQLITESIKSIEEKIEKTRDKNSLLRELLKNNSDKLNTKWSGKNDFFNLNQSINTTFNEDLSFIDISSATEFVFEKNKISKETALTFSEFIADWEIQNYLQQKLAEINPSTYSKYAKLKWNLDQRDFIRIVYSLFHSQILTNNKNEIANLVRELAERLDFDLSTSWRQNLSNSLNNSNADFEHTKIFDIMKQGFSDFERKHNEKLKSEK